MAINEIHRIGDMRGFKGEMKILARIFTKIGVPWTNEKQHAIEVGPTSFLFNTEGEFIKIYWKDKDDDKE